VLAFDFTVPEDQSSDWVLVAAMSDGTLCRLAPHAAGDDHALLPAWPTPARALPVPPELPANLSVALARQLEESWPRLSCTAVGEDGWVASGDSTGRIRLWRAENGASGGELGFSTHASNTGKCIIAELPWYTRRSIFFS
jgi:hypothetical protein